MLAGSGPAAGQPLRASAVAAVAERRRRRPRARREPLVAAIALAFVLALPLVATRHGIGRTDDSLVYLATAENVIDGRGITVPFPTLTLRADPESLAGHAGALPAVDFPPGYPLALAALRVVGLSPDGAARVLGAALFATNLGLSWVLARRLVPDHPGVPACLVALLAAGPAVTSPLGKWSWLTLSSVALSEPLFLAFLLGTLLTLDAFVRTRHAGRLWLAATLAGAAALTRFAGAALAPTILLTVLGSARWLPRGRRAAFGAGASLVSLAPLGVWLGYQRWTWGDLALRDFRVRSFPSSEVRRAITVAGAWFVPPEGPLCGPSGPACSPHRHRDDGRRRDPKSPPTGACKRRAAHGRAPAGGPAPARRGVPGHLPHRGRRVEVVGRPRDPLRARILAPAQLTTYLLVVPVLVRGIGAAGDTRVRRLAVPAILLLTASLALPSTVRAIAHLNRPGAGSRLDHGPLMSTLRRLEPETIVVTNRPGEVHEATGHAALRIPVTSYLGEDRPDPDYRSNLDSLGDLLREEKAVVAYFTDPSFLNFVTPPIGELARELDLTGATFGDGVLLRAAPPGTAATRGAKGPVSPPRTTRRGGPGGRRCRGSRGSG
ncbi:MAG: hypothetical protein M5U14_19070 [Acidimicrobiia bacterium]|nr:hypothetical protein [Acidimicrobiia bacterium]